MRAFIALEGEDRAMIDFIEKLCDATGCTFAQIRNPRTEKQRWARDVLIINLARMELSLKRIHTLAGTSQEYAQRVLDVWRNDTLPIKTQKWEVA